MFQKFKINKLVAHYITSSPTSQAGDVMFYYERDRNAPMIDYSNSSFLPFILSDPHTVIGPQWTNHSAAITPTKEWKTTLFGNQEDINEDASGTLFFFSKTNAANSPGYLLIDYDIQFKELSINPRSGTLPVARAQSSFICFQRLAAAITVDTQFNTGSVTAGKTISNTTSTAVSGQTDGDVYKVVFQISASTLVNAAWIGVTTANLLQFAPSNTITLDDGFTCYALVSGGTWYLFPTYQNALTSTGALQYGTTSAAASYSICAEAQLVGNIRALTQASY
jgi:hypothetical protein